MKRNDKVRKLVPIWADKIGRTHARKRISDEGWGLSTADQLVTKRYKATPSDRLADCLLRLMAEDGITLDGAKAS